MRKYLIPKDGNFYKANLHCHSIYSDGKLTVEELKERYKEKGYSVVAFTDHDFIMEHSYLNDENFLAITSCEISIKEIAELSTSEKRDMKVCHLNFYAKDPKNVDTPFYSSVYDKYSAKHNLNIIHTEGEYERVYSKECISDMIKKANEKGFLVCYNHPVWSLENATDYLGYKGLFAMEIYNTSCNLLGHFEYNINAYDDFLRIGERLGCIAADDSHSPASVGHGYVMIKAESLSYDNIIKALENHDFYASNGPKIKELYIEDNVAHLTYEGGEFAVMSTRGRRIKRVLAENPDGENTAKFDILPDEDGYIRFSILDKYGKFANSCAYFL